MTVLDQIVLTIAERETDWAQFAATHTAPSPSANATEWGRKGGSGGKEGEFWKK
ncbi:multiple cyclophane-containing RiPP AmcA [Amycolatopsis sp. NPDC051373]|uniref:multiple cyclophane-containing RiPP AmcA n=1 Tax=Amycolatopsis sp. NPDC051373 TaxID=3155801 RepID=UPI00344E93CD